MLSVVANDAHAQTPYSGHGADSLSPEIIRKYAPPPLDPSVSRRIQTMLDVRSPGLGQVTPDGKRLFFVWNTTGTPTLWRLDGPKGVSRADDRRRGPHGRSPTSPPTASSSCSRATTAARKTPGLYVQPVEGGATRVIQHKKGSRAFYGFVQDDARTLWFRANDLKPDSYAIHRGDLAHRQERDRVLGAGPLGHRGPSRRGGRGDAAPAEDHGVGERRVLRVDSRRRRR